MQVLWYNSLNMQRHQPKPFHLYVANVMNTTEGISVVHNALYSRNYAKYAAMAGVNYTVYYTDYNGMTDGDRGDRRFDALNYRSDHDWVQQPGVMQAGRASKQEQMLYHCFALGMDCSTSSLGL